MAGTHRTTGVTSGLLDRLVPFHLELDADLHVRRAGEGLRALLPGVEGRSLFDVVSVLSPPLATPADLRAAKGKRLRCALRGRALPLRAQLLEAGDDAWLFVATPWLTSADELREAGLDPGLAAPHEGWADPPARPALEPAAPDSQELAARLEDREARLGALIDTAIDAIVTIDDGCKIEHVNPATLRLFGYTAEELIGRDFWVLMPSAEEDRDIEFLEILAMSGIRGEFRAVARDGATFLTELSASKLVVRGRARFTAILRDISERKKLEQLQSEFVSTVSHELRTPLTAIHGALGLCAAGVTGALPPDAEECVQIALANSQRLIRLINDILDLEKIQSGQMEFRMERLELRDVVRAGLQANATFSAAHGIQLRLLGEPAAGQVLGDEHRLIQVLTNLVSNAAKFSPPHGIVDISVDDLGDVLRVSVRDRGQGVPEEFQDRIFQRFAQADGSSTRQKGGTGLGLSISKTIIEYMHGTIGFAPAGGGGTAFYFDLPRARPLAERSRVPV
jgi:PAS domain S-box-containing protein